MPHSDHPPSGHPAPHPHLIAIIVNSRPRQVEKRELSYAQVLELAFPGAANTETKIYTITFERAAGPRHEGSLVAGETVHIHQGTQFHVTATDRS